MNMGSARKTLAPIEPDTIKNKDFVMGLKSPSPDLMTEVEKKMSASNSLNSGY